MNTIVHRKTNMINRKNPTPLHTVCTTDSALRCKEVYMKSASAISNGSVLTKLKKQINDHKYYLFRQFTMTDLCFRKNLSKAFRKNCFKHTQ